MDDFHSFISVILQAFKKNSIHFMPIRTIFTQEYILNASPSLVYKLISSATGLAQWFADEVTFSQEEFTFIWEGTNQKAQLVEKSENEFVRFHWNDTDNGEYFELSLNDGGITSGTVLTITDFANESDVSDQRLLWNAQVKTLLQMIGA